MRRRSMVRAALAASVSLLGCLTSTAYATAGTGQVVDTVTATTTTGGLLTLAGVGVSVSVQGTPGSWSATTGATVLTVSDLTGTTNGWSVTADYSPPAAGTSLGGDNVEVTGSNVTPDASGGVPAGNVTLAVDQPLTSAVTVATTGANSGSGVTDLTASLKVRLPTTAQVGDVYGGTVTYTVASVR